MSWTHTSDNNNAAIWLVALGSTYIVYKALKSYLMTPSAIDTLRGPKSSSWMLGNTQTTRMPYFNESFQKWMREYGAVIPVHVFLGAKELLIMDTNAMAFILNQPDKFPKPRVVANQARYMLGDGILAAEGSEHKRQVRIRAFLGFNPRTLLKFTAKLAQNSSFSTLAIRDVSPLVMQVAHELRDEWKKLFPEPSSKLAIKELDVLDWSGKAALDMIGIACFGYKFGSLQDSNNELASAFAHMSKNLSAITGITLLSHFFPVLRRIMMRLGLHMVAERKAEAEQLGEGGAPGGKDLLTVMVRANKKEKAQERLDDKTLSAQISSIIQAGHEPTANSVA
ncbi:hypothetical protein FRB93_003880 [Tulasnella sp. JGI-2019a]|nr:hypothetical protein FRB93_003880 [Tulasnella sp. JGI-2019a]